MSLISSIQLKIINIKQDATYPKTMGKNIDTKSSAAKAVSNIDSWNISFSNLKLHRPWSRSFASAVPFSKIFLKAFINNSLLLFYWVRQGGHGGQSC